MFPEIEGVCGVAARSLAQRLFQFLGASLVSVQVVGRKRPPGRPARPAPLRPGRDVDVLVILARLSEELEARVLSIGAEIEQEYAAGLALKVTTPRQIEILGSRGTPLWELLETGIPLLAEAPTRLALPAPPAAKTRRSRPAERHLDQGQARERAASQLVSAETLLEAGQFADAVSLAFASIRSQALAWLPREELHGLRESELTRTFLEALPEGRRGPLARRVRFAKRLRDQADLGCQEIKDPHLARQVVEETRGLFQLLLGEGAGPPAPSSSLNGRGGCPRSSSSQ